MKYGKFDDVNKEYVIRTYNTPLPWINYLGTNDFFSLISNAGGGYSFYRDAKYRRLTRYRYNNVPRDSSGRLYYIDDGEVVFSPSFFPAQTPLDQYECRHGLSYTRFISSKNNISAELLCFVPLDASVEINQLTITNNSETIKELLIYGGVEFCLWNAQTDGENFQRNLSIGEVEVLPELIIHKSEYRERRNHFAYFGVNHPTIAFDTDRDTFLGLHRNYSNPVTIEARKLNNSIASGWAPIAMHQIKIKLEPGASKTLIFQLGYIEHEATEKWEKPNVVNKTKVNMLKHYYDDKTNVQTAFQALKSHWQDALSIYNVKTNDVKFDRMNNIWHQYQCMVTFNLSRSASYFESGISRGIGFRDSCQDLLGFVHLVPTKARERLLDLATIQLTNGGTMHQYQPLDKKGNDEIGSGFNDDPLWLIAATYAYLSETNDYSVLDDFVAYHDAPTTKEPLLAHLTKAYNYTLNNLGPHGLPLIGRADWNDCLNLNCFSTKPDTSFQVCDSGDGHIAESIFIGGMFVKYATEYAHILTKLNMPIIEVNQAITKMKQALYKHGWDGEHFLRAYDANGDKVGSNINHEGQIYIEPQGMCVMAGVGLDNGMAKQALASVNLRLATNYGIKLLTPAYTTYNPKLGEISSYPPGYKENGAIFCHNNPWVIIAETLVKNNERAFTYYKNITPAYLEPRSKIHKSEPYVYAQMIAGDDAVNFGEAKNSWLTGTAAWTFVAASQYIMGIRPTLDGLVIDPVLPAHINEFTVIRKYQNATYTIKGKRGAAYALFVNDVQVASNLITNKHKGVVNVNVIYI